MWGLGSRNPAATDKQLCLQIIEPLQMVSKSELKSYAVQLPLE